ncbi:ATP-binding protein [Nocardioides speluncae]|uniref:ATP-binding protein n=1 Tax=Nocardioides speluncae TaxID=2670337 RepID=UPI0023E7ACC2|nr:AAA family ATPase [Nocardioides speluncae]
MLVGRELVGRERERRTVDRLLAAARSGSSGALVVVGEAGIGKTALLAHAQAMAGDTEMQVLHTVGVESETDLPFGGLSRLLRPLLPLLDKIPEPQAEALSRALALRAGAAPDRFAVAASVLSLVCRAAEDQPLLVVVDDMHHLDRPSLDAVSFVARRLLTDAVVVLIGVRPDLGVEELLGDLDRLELSGLDLAASRRLVSDRPLTTEQLQRLHQVTGGNPLAVLEMVALPEVLEREGPGGPVPELIVRAYAAQLGSLEPAARTALLLAAAGDVDLATLERACAASGTQIAALADAERIRLLEVDPVAGQVRFRHPLVRAAIYQAADPAQRRGANRVLANALTDGDPERRAWHLAEATLGTDPEVAAVLRGVAESAANRSAHAVATHYFERAARLDTDPVGRADLLLAAGEEAWAGGLSDRAVALLDEAGRSAGGEAVRTAALAHQGMVLARCGSLEDASALLLEAGRAAGADDPDQATMLLAELVYSNIYLGHMDTIRIGVAELAKLAGRQLTARARRTGDLASGMGMIINDDGEAGVLRIRRAVADAALDGDPDTEDAEWLTWLVRGHLWLRETGVTRSLLDTVITQVRYSAAIGSLPYLLFHVARDDATTDRWAAADATYREAVTLARETGQRTELGASLAGLAWLLARQGREAEARVTAGDGELACRHSRNNLGRVWLQFALGDLEAGIGNTEAALDHYRSAHALTSELGVRDADLSPAPEVVDCLMRTGQEEAAVAEARGFQAVAAAKGQPWALARAHRALAVAGVDPDHNFTAALALHADTAEVYERARTALAYGAYLRRDRRRSEARDHLRRALADFDRLSARPWAEAAATELAATGERVPRRAGAVTQQLTAQEFQVARLLADGRTTREAAAALFLSPKTVEYHLRHVYIKLGISSRRQLAESLSSVDHARSSTDPA